LKRATRCHKLGFKGHDLLIELNDSILEGKNNIFIGSIWFSKVGSNGGGISELSLHP